MSVKPACPVPPFSPDNPGKGTGIRASFSSAQRSWEDEADALVCLARVLRARRLAFEQHEARLDLPDGLTLRPQFVRLQPRDDESVSTVSTIEVNHPQLCPQGTFEYQHAIGRSISDSLELGFTGWADTDLPVFIDALRDELKDCTAVVTSQERWPRKRQIIFGPPVRAMRRPTQEEAPAAHDFCPCCLFTNCFDAFVQFLEGNSFCGVRLFASRDDEGATSADCRIDGVDWPAGAEALRKYAATWPGQGLEYRKQYVLIRNLPED
jgi:hypothetical protein